MRLLDNVWGTLSMGHPRRRQAATLRNGGIHSLAINSSERNQRKGQNLGIYVALASIAPSSRSAVFCASLESSTIVAWIGQHKFPWLMSPLALPGYDNMIKTVEESASVQKIQASDPN